MTDYLRTIKHHADNLRQAVSPVATRSLIFQVLLGLDEEFNPIAEVIQGRLNILWAETQSELLLFEKRLDYQLSLKSAVSFVPTTSINMVSGRPTGFSTLVIQILPVANSLVAPVVSENVVVVDGIIVRSRPVKCVAGLGIYPMLASTGLTKTLPILMLTAPPMFHLLFHLVQAIRVIIIILRLHPLKLLLFLAHAVQICFPLLLNLLSILIGTWIVVHPTTLLLIRAI